MFFIETVLASAFNGVLKLLGIRANSPEYYDEVVKLMISWKESLSINSYYHLIRYIYNSHGTERMHDLIVEEVGLCKRAAPLEHEPEHEYVFAKVKPRPGATSRAPFYVVFERNLLRYPYNFQQTGDTPDSSNSTPSPTLPSPAPQPGPEEMSPEHEALPHRASLSDDAASVSEMAFNDSSAVHNAPSSAASSAKNYMLTINLPVYHYGGRYARGDTVCCRLTFKDDSPLYFYELIALAKGIYNAEEQDLLIHGQRSGSIVGVLQDVCSNISVYQTYGSYNLLPAYAENRLKVAKLISLYEEAKATLTTPVYEIEQAKLKDVQTNAVLRMLVAERKKIIDYRAQEEAAWKRIAELEQQLDILDPEAASSST